MRGAKVGGKETKEEIAPSLLYPMNLPGIPVSRWIDGVMEDKKNVAQKDNIRAVFFQGHACNSQTRGVEMKKALEKLDMVVISDPHPTHMAVMSDRKNDTYLLPTCTQYETYGSLTASNRSPNPCRTIPFCTSWQKNWASKRRCSRTSKSPMMSL